MRADDMHDSLLSTSGEGILRVNPYFRTLGLKVLFAETAYAPICHLILAISILTILALIILTLIVETAHSGAKGAHSGVLEDANSGAN